MALRSPPFLSAQSKNRGSQVGGGVERAELVPIGRPVSAHGIAAEQRGCAVAGGAVGTVDRRRLALRGHNSLTGARHAVDANAAFNRSG